MVDAITFENTSRFAETEIGKIHYHEAGEGPVLLMIHGSGPGVRGWANFEGTLSFFADHFRCLVIDLPGYGDSDAVEGQPVMMAVDATIKLLDAIGVDKTHIIGNSLGGMVGSFIAAFHPQRVNSFVCMGGIGMSLYSPFPGEGLNLLSAFAEDPTRERITAWLSSMVFDQSLVTEELIESRMAQATEPKTLASTRQMYSKESIKAIADMATGPETAARIGHLASINAPTLLTWGRDDRVTPLDGSIIPMRIIPNCELHVFPNCGHWVMIERKHEFENIVLAFLQR